MSNPEMERLDGALAATYPILPLVGKVDDEEDIIFDNLNNEITFSEFSCNIEMNESIDDDDESIDNIYIRAPVISAESQIFMDTEFYDNYWDSLIKEEKKHYDTDIF